jgi:hypothetical protein
MAYVRAGVFVLWVKAKVHRHGFLAMPNISDFANRALAQYFPKLTPQTIEPDAVSP